MYFSLVISMHYTNRRPYTFWISRYHLDLCRYVFGEGVYPDVFMTNLYYGGTGIAGSSLPSFDCLLCVWHQSDHEKLFWLSNLLVISLIIRQIRTASKIVFTNGSQDPWRHASKQKSSKDSESSRTLYGIHCSVTISHTNPNDLFRAV